MLADTNINQDGTTWLNTTNQACGKENLYTVVYPSYESLGFVSGGANDNDQSPPTTGNGAPVSFPNSDYDDYWDISRIMIMGVRDTWQDYMRGEQTNCLFGNMTSQGNPYAVVAKSSPMEPYWTHQHGPDSDPNRICNEDGSDPHQKYSPDSIENLITYPQYVANADKVGFARPYIWSEGMWEEHIDNTNSNENDPDAHPKRNLSAQGWKGISGNYNSYDADVEGETSAFCRECLDGDGLIVTVFNHDMTSDREDLRVHAVNATTGVHTWDYHMPAKLAGDYFNATPAIANNLVFVAYQRHTGRQSILQVINADSGTGKQRVPFDSDSDVVVIPPTIANGAVYVGSYDFNTGTDNNSMDDDVIRIFAYSPMLRMYSVGIYPMSTSLSLTDTEFSNMPRAERKLQVWITGDESKWEEIRGVYEP
jgi:hypothetical protein